MPDKKCTEAEWKILALLWDQAPRTMSEITKALEPQTGWTRHTVITLLKRMQEKGTVRIDETGDVKRYFPLVTREEMSAQQTQKLLDRVFSGQASLLISHLVENGEITVREMDELMEMLRKNGKR